MQIEQHAIRRPDLAQQQRPAVAQLRREMAELMPGIGLRHRPRAGRHTLAAQHRRARDGIQLRRKPKGLGQRPVEPHHAGCRHFRRLPGHAQARQLAGVATQETDLQRRGGQGAIRVGFGTSIKCSGTGFYAMVCRGFRDAWNARMGCVRKGLRRGVCQHISMLAAMGKGGEEP